MEHGFVKIKIGDNEITAKEGQSIAEALREHGIKVPTLCDYKSLPPAGTCRLCTVKVAGRFVSSCTTPVSHGMVIDYDSAEIQDLRKSLIEMLFVEGNHMCPSCEKSGNCELQKLAYDFHVTAPRFPFMFPVRTVEAQYPHLLIEHNRCIQCLRCVRGVKNHEGKDLFGFTQRGNEIQVTLDHADPDGLTESTAQKAMDICPVGALIKKKAGFSVPIGQRKFEHEPGTQEEK